MNIRGVLFLRVPLFYVQLRVVQHHHAATGSMIPFAGEGHAARQAAQYKD